MPAPRNSLVVLAALAASLVCAPAAAASPAPHAKAKRTARVARAEPRCQKAPVAVVAGNESATFALTGCDGVATPAAVDELSLLARPAAASRPKEPLTTFAKSRGPELAPGIRRIDPRLLERLEQVVEHFTKDGQTAKLVLVSGYRPKSAGSYHSRARALDFRLDGVENEAVVAFCKTLPDTGCGYYPRSMFVHIDARDPGAGHVAWIDASAPGEPPRYVTAWPAPADSPPSPGKLPALPADEHAGAQAPKGPAVPAAALAVYF